MGTDTRQQTIKILTEELKLNIDPATISADRLIEDLGMSSIHLMNVMYDLEEAFHIRLDPEEMLAIGTVGHLLDLLDSKIAAAPQKSAAAR
jgi:acyl carrier protein